MSQDNCIPKSFRDSPNENNSHGTEFVPQKAIGVKPDHKPVIHNQSEEHPSQKSKAHAGLTQPNPKQYFENAFHVVSELEENHGIKTKGNQKSVLECIADYNRKSQCPTQKEILSDLKKITDENLKKIMQILRKMGLVITHPEKIGNEHQYVLSNMQDIIKFKNAAKKNGTGKEIEGEEAREEFALENNIQNFFLQVLKNRANPEFHNITLASQLSDNGDYYRIHNWLMPSKENEGKTFENRISRHRTFRITVYPKGTTTINIAASRQPFGWYCREGWIDFISICGQILQEIKNELSNTEPLKSKMYDWQVTQMHVGYDIPLSNLDGKNKSPSKGSFTIPRMFNGCLKVKHLDRVYQIYNKQLPNKGSCLRVEEQHSFSSTHTPTTTPSTQSLKKNEISKENMMTVHELKKSFQPTSVEEIIKTVFSIETSSCSSSHFTSN